ncbi:MAG: hypothetical protein BWX88_05241 [Planctomycetes bacterium ADurb.Bin126]|nr:MAG: hypothetical protein BWX88_05241 [Planctomycetes bacterium ADurb.Bin126]
MRSMLAVTTVCCWPLVSVGTGPLASDGACPLVLVISVAATRALWSMAVTVCIGSSIGRVRESAPPWLQVTMNGSAALTTNRSMPRAIRRSVASASGRFRSKMDGHGRLQSMHSAAARQGFRPRASHFCRGAWVRLGQTIFSPSQRAMRKNRFRVVGTP